MNIIASHIKQIVIQVMYDLDRNDLIMDLVTETDHCFLTKIYQYRAIKIARRYSLWYNVEHH